MSGDYMPMKHIRTISQGWSALESMGWSPIKILVGFREGWVLPPHGKDLGALPYDEYLKTPQWAEHRRRVREWAGGRCQGCNSDRNLETHHRTYERRGQELLSDLTLLCTACHTAVHLVMDARAGKERKTSRRADY